MTLVTKVAGVLLVGGGIVGTGTAYALNSGTNEPEKTISIKETLSNEGKKLLEGEDQELWGIKLATYKRLPKTDTNLNLPNENETWEKLKIWCGENIEADNNEKNKKIYKRVKEVCTIPSNKEKLLSADKKLATEKQDWANRTQAYGRESTDSPIAGIDKTKIKENDLENWCKQELEEEYKKADSKEALYIKWCTKDGN